MNFYPKAIGDFLAWGDNFVIQVSINTTAIGITQPEIISLETAWNSYKDAQATATADATRSSIAIAEARRLHDLALAAIIRVKNGYVDPALVKGLINETIYREFGLKPHAPHHPPLPRPTDMVEFEVTLLASGHQVSCKYHIAGRTTRGKGRYHGVEVAFIVLPLDAPAPISVADAWVSKVDTSSPWEHIFNDADVGKRCYITMRWENPSAGNNMDDDEGKGTWAPIKNFIVP